MGVGVGGETINEIPTKINQKTEEKMTQNSSRQRTKETKIKPLISFLFINSFSPRVRKFR